MAEPGFWWWLCSDCFYSVLRGRPFRELEIPNLSGERKCQLCTFKKHVSGMHFVYLTEASFTGTTAREPALQYLLHEVVQYYVSSEPGMSALLDAARVLDLDTRPDSAVHYELVLDTGAVVGCLGTRDPRTVATALRNDPVRIVAVGTALCRNCAHAGEKR